MDCEEEGQKKMKRNASSGGPMAALVIRKEKKIGVGRGPGL